MQPNFNDLLQLINDLYDESECRYDHHGYCQTHAWFSTNVMCPHKRAKILFAALNAADNNEGTANAS